MPVQPVLHRLVAIAERHDAAAAREWLERGLHDGGSFALVYAGIGRRFGRRHPELNDREIAELRNAGVADPTVWNAADFARGALLASAMQDGPDDEALAGRLFRRGDNAEREALLRSLMLLPRPERFLAIAIESCRSSVQSVFEAIACENAYPAAFFPEANFNQMVLKALFTGADVRRVAGLAGRCGAELVRMAEDYASERRAASRPVPDGVGLIVELARRASA